jgi:transcriptional regulator with XRE-family HTH domain
MKTIGEKIRYVRNLKDWSQEEMADKLNISLPGYSKIERNITDLGFARLTQIAKVFGMSVIDLLSVTSKPGEHTNLQKLLAEKEKEINRLQKKIIELMEVKK